MIKQPKSSFRSKVEQFKDRVAKNSKVSPFFLLNIIKNSDPQQRLVHLPQAICVYCIYNNYMYKIYQCIQNMCVLYMCISICKNHKKMSLKFLPFDISHSCMYIWFLVSISVSCYKARRCLHMRALITLSNNWFLMNF